MKPGSVQIGDHYLLEGRVVTVVGILENLAVLRPSRGFMQVVRQKDLQPIPVTPLQLEKNGFVPMSYEDCYELKRASFRVRVFMDEEGMMVVADNGEDSVQKDGRRELQLLQQAMRFVDIDQQLEAYHG
jgi:predicted CoA-binding protein